MHSPSYFTTPQVTHPVPKEADHDIDVAHMDNNFQFGIPNIEPSSEESSYQVVITNNVHSVNQPPEHISKLDSKIIRFDNVFVEPSRTRSPLEHQYIIKHMLCYLMFSFLPLNPRVIKNMQEELNEFERLEVWELVPCLDHVMIITLKRIYKVKLDELGGVLKNKARLVAWVISSREGLSDLNNYSCSSCTT
ncbi:hypothetical protein Tco_0776764 [Tanacetum coccineum]